ncbi:uncharacterized protein KY384_001360 [Bacidia gigantensis]|uniref:uncharacterized protein n=1 Tax=Bacidia gigantensis TaxID=2732470 RepID=UPI001D0586A9|nr:uncharacterized protein KY384_001360 [Bacidia gigantensis]KAG8533620.1 hypothetical protein KY384_001360 [Bacidia gigantensis]
MGEGKQALLSCSSPLTPGTNIEGQLAQHLSTPLTPESVKKYKEVKAQRGQDAQEFLRQEAFAPLVEKVHVEDSEVDYPETPNHRFPVRIYRPPMTTAEKFPVMLYFHGGYWSAGDYYSEDLGCRAIIARGCHIIIYSFSYRLIGQAPWHELFSDAEHAMKWLWSNASTLGADVNKGFLVGGAEAGAHLAAICTIRARNKYPNIAISGQCLIVPTLIAWPDPEIPKEWEDGLMSHVEQADAPILNEALYEQLVDALNVPAEQKRVGENFPMWGPLHDLPRAYLAMDECDPTRDQGFLYEKLLRRAGVNTRTDYYRGLPNMFVQFPGLPTTAGAGGHFKQYLVNEL